MHRSISYKHIVLNCYQLFHLTILIFLKRFYILLHVMCSRCLLAGRYWRKVGLHSLQQRFWWNMYMITYHLNHYVIGLNWIRLKNYVHFPNYYKHLQTSTVVAFLRAYKFSYNTYVTLSVRITDESWSSRFLRENYTKAIIVSTFYLTGHYYYFFYINVMIYNSFVTSQKLWRKFSSLRHINQWKSLT